MDAMFVDEMDVPEMTR